MCNIYFYLLFTAPFNLHKPNKESSLKAFWVMPQIEVCIEITFLGMEWADLNY